MRRHIRYDFASAARLNQLTQLLADLVGWQLNLVKMRDTVSLLSGLQLTSYRSRLP